MATPKLPKIGEAFEDIIAKRGVDKTELSERAGVSVAAINAAIRGTSGLDEDSIYRIAEELAVPVTALFRKSAPLMSEVKDFRKSSASKSQYEKNTLKAIEYAEKISGSLLSIYSDFDLDDHLRANINELTPTSASNLAKEWRKRWGITDDDQLDWKNSTAMYSSLRDFIEEAGIFVLHYRFKSSSVSGMYTRVSNGPHIIIINTTSSSKGRKLFTLAHEFCHVLLRESGISNVSLTNNKVEKFCNKFAALLLAPDTVIRSAIKRYKYEIEFSDDLIRLLAKNLGISQQCCFYRLVEMGELSRTDYTNWMKRFSNSIPTGDESDGQGGVGDTIQNKRTQYGLSLLRVLSEAKSKGFIDDIDIFRLCGIKPKYQSALFASV